MHKLDLTGKTLNNIRVIGPSGTSSSGATLWDCECLLCGAHFVAVGHRLTDKKYPQKDCGCTRRAARSDLTGKTFGDIFVIRRTGTGHRNESTYLCRCNRCGSEKERTASQIRSGIQACSCVRHDLDFLSKISKKGVDKTIQNGVNVYTATRTEANSSNMTTGLRWVVRLSRKGQTVYAARFRLRGVIYYKYGFTSAESAHAWAEVEHARALEREGVHPPEKRRTKKSSSPESLKKPMA